MNPIRPADVDPPRLLDAIDQWKVNQAFGSPALWKAIGRYCDAHQRTCPSLKFVLSAGAPVPPSTLMSIRQMMHPDGLMFTPYGATEALPIASIESREVLDETAVLTESVRELALVNTLRASNGESSGLATIQSLPSTRLMSYQRAKLVS